MIKKRVIWCLVAAGSVACAQAATVSDPTFAARHSFPDMAFADRILTISPSPPAKLPLTTAGVAFAPVDYAHLGLLLFYAGILVAGLPRRSRRSKHRRPQAAAEAMSRTR